MPQHQPEIEINENPNASEAIPVSALERNCFIVGIGASAGGLQALEEFFAHMPRESGAAFVVIQHLSPEYKSLMKELLSRCTHMEIHRVDDGADLAPNTIYLIPPGQNLIVSEGRLHLTKQDRLHCQLHFPIDLFFESLARDCPERAIAIVLSGTGSDGSKGIRALREAGGTILVQEPTTAEFDGMPRNALATGMVHRSLSAPELAQLAGHLVSSPDLRKEMTRPLVSIQEEDLQTVLQLLSERAEVDFRQYKIGTLNRRIQRRCLLLGHQSLDSYLELLAASTEECQQLREDLLISVTHFFRDPAAWEFLETEILPPLVEAMSADAPLRIWVTACSTGQEAYSMAIAIHEVARARGKRAYVKIFATDIDRDSLAQAARGFYPSTIAEELSPERLQRYFTPKEGGYAVIRPIRETIVFAHHNLIGDVSFSRIQLVSCRNASIYMQPALQKQVLRNLHFALELKGILFLGESETLADLDSEFDVRERRYKIFEKRRNVRLSPALPLHLTPASVRPALERPPETRSSRDRSQEPRLQAAFKLLVADRNSCCLILDSQGCVQQIFGATPELLPPPSGPISNEAIKMVAAPLQLPLSIALKRARQSPNEAIRCPAISLSSDSDSPQYSLQVYYQKDSHLPEEFAIVTLCPDEARARDSSSALGEALSGADIDLHVAQHILDLEAELQRTRECLQATTEEIETRDEEHQAASEELIAANEELQSTNEELQSLNEEIHTINSEYQSKIQELIELNNDIDNLLKSIDVGVIFLDRDLIVRRFTPAAAEIFALLAGDLGRPLAHITHNLDITDLAQQLQTALEIQKPLEIRANAIGGDRHILIRLNPYCLQNGQVDGLVLAFVDVTEFYNSQKALEERNILLDTVISSTVDPVFVKDLEGRYKLVNEATAKAFGKSQAEIIGTDDWEHFPAELVPKIVADDREVLASGQNLTLEESLGGIDYLTTRTVLQGKNGEPQGLVGIARDITPLNKAQQRLEDINQKLQQINQKLQQEVDWRQAALLELQASERRYRNTFEQANVGIVQIAIDGTLIHTNQHFANFTGYEKAELLDKKFPEIIYSEDVETDSHSLQQLLAGGIPGYEVEKRFIKKNQEMVWAKLTFGLSRGDEEDSRYIIAVVQDISKRVQLENEHKRILQELIQEKELAQVTLHSIGDAVIATDANAKVQYCNPVAEQLTGWSTAEAQGRPLQEVVTLLKGDAHEPTANLISSGLDSSEHLILQSRDGSEFTVSASVSPMHDRQRNFLGVVAIFRDVTEAHTLSCQLTWQACHDPLTELLNRRRFEEELNQAIESIRIDEREEHVLCYIDLDQFKVVNDTGGHVAGDELLRQVAMILKGHVRSSDRLARLGGDEFGLLLRNCSRARAEDIVDSLRETVQAFRFVWETNTFNIGISIGVVAINSSTVNLPSILCAADAACYAAKERGRNRAYVYQPNDTHLARQRRDREWSIRIHNALERDLFCLYQQRIISSERSDKDPQVGYEILLRMIDEDGTLIPPNAFIPAAERYDLMPRIDRWVVKNFFSYIAASAEVDPSEIYMINISGASLTDENFLAFLKKQLSHQANLAQHICFEITETVAVSNLTEAVKFINELQGLGCKFALDDFGSGMSSFGYLKALPVNYIKIDGRFVRDIETDPTAKAIVESIHNIGHVMGLQSIAEFVESGPIQNCVRDIGVDYLQGYFISHPQPLLRKA